MIEDQSIEEIEGDFDDYRKEVLDELGEEILNPSLIANRAVEQWCCCMTKKYLISFIFITGESFMSIN